MRPTHSKAEYTFKLVVTHEGITHSKTVLKRTLKIDNANETFVVLCKTIQAAGFDQSGFQPPLPPQGDLVVALVGYGRDGSQLSGMWNRVGVTQAKATEQPAPVILVRLSTDGYASAAIYGDAELIIFDESGLRSNIANEYEDCDDPEIDKTYEEFGDEFNALYNDAPHNQEACFYPSDIQDIKAAVQKRLSRP